MGCLSSYVGNTPHLFFYSHRMCTLRNYYDCSYTDTLGNWIDKFCDFCSDYYYFDHLSMISWSAGTGAVSVYKIGPFFTAGYRVQGVIRT